jgi:hypothetical protein
MLRDLALRVLPAAVVFGALLACKLPGAGKDDSAAASAAAPVAPPAATPVAPPPAAVASAAPVAAAASAVPEPAGTEYSTAGITPVPDNCVEAFAVLTAVPTAVHDKADFFWRFAQQVAVANPQFKYGTRDLPREVVFEEGPHAPTKGIALAAHCKPGKHCNQLAAAYKTVVPTSKPELVCGKPPPTVTLSSGAAVIELVPTPPDGELRFSPENNLPTKTDVVAQCVRLAACKAERDKKLEGDPAIECQKKPTAFKVACAFEKSCKAVLACTGD